MSRTADYGEPTVIRDDPLVMHNYKTTYYWGPEGNPSSGLGFKLKGANCPNYTTPECAKCDEWTEFMDQTGGPIDGCDPLENCIDCELREPCPCFDIDRMPGEYKKGWVICACGCGQEFRKKSGTHRYATMECRERNNRRRRDD